MKQVLTHYELYSYIFEVKDSTEKILNSLSYDQLKTPFSELCTRGKRAYKYTLQAADIYFIIKYINRDLR